MEVLGIQTNHIFGYSVDSLSKNECLKIVTILALAALASSAIAFGAIHVFSLNVSVKVVGSAVFTVAILGYQRFCRFSHQIGVPFGADQQTFKNSG